MPAIHAEPSPQDPGPTPEARVLPARRQSEIGGRRNELCRVVQTFWCSLCRSHIILDSGASHAIASRRRILMEGAALRPWCQTHKQFVVPIEELTARTHICPVCRKPFTPKRSSALYCSSLCSQKAKRLGRDPIEGRMQSDSFMRRCQAPGCDICTVIDGMRGIVPVTASQEGVFRANPQGVKE